MKSLFTTFFRMERVVFEVGSCGEAQAPAVVGEVELVDGVMGYGDRTVP